MSVSDFDVMVLCAGLGTRLRPLTLELPKPAVPLLNRPLVAYSFALARAAGFSRATINTHWLPDAMRAAAKTEATALRMTLSVSHEPQLLGTGGGLWQARERRLLRPDADVLVLNGDVLFDVALDRVMKEHTESEALATMVLRPMPEGATYSPVQLDSDGDVCRIGKYGKPVDGPSWLFTGVHVLSAEALALLPEGESSVIEQVYARLLEQGALIHAVIDEGLWLDLGDPEGYLGAHLTLLSGETRLGPLVKAGALPAKPEGIAKGVEIESGARVVRSTIGAGAVIGANAVVEDSVIWAGTFVDQKEEVTRMIVTPRSCVVVPSGTGEPTD